MVSKMDGPSIRYLINYTCDSQAKDYLKLLFSKNELFIFMCIIFKQMISQSFKQFCFAFQTFNNNNLNINSLMLAGKAVDKITDHRIDMFMLSIIFVGFFSCLIRSDYNLLFMFFCYFVWQNRKDALALKIIAGATIILFVIDLLFLLTEIPVWNGVDPKNPVWQTIHPLHSFGIFCFVIINILKLILFVITIRANSAANQAQ